MAPRHHSRINDSAWSGETGMTSPSTEQGLTRGMTSQSIPLGLIVEFAFEQGG